MNVAEYRLILKDNKSSDDLIKKRILFIESFCRTIIKGEIENYENNKHRGIYKE